MATHSSILAWKIPWAEEPGGLQFMGSQGFGHDLATKQQHVEEKPVSPALSTSDARAVGFSYTSQSSVSLGTT